jgi:predicted DNA-binding transcriptional regulator
MNEEPLDMGEPKPLTDEKNLKSLKQMIKSAPTEEIKEGLQNQIDQLEQKIKNETKFEKIK